MRADGRLLRSWSEGRAEIPGFLDDYASMAVGLFALYSATGNLRWYEEAQGLTDATPGLFARDDGGFYATGVDAERLIKRPVDITDNPLPSGNSLAAEGLLLSSLYTGDLTRRTLAEGAVRAGATYLGHHPTMTGHLLSVLHSLTRGPKELAVTGPLAQSLARPARARFRPGVALAVDVEGSAGMPLLEGRFEEGLTRAYLCEGFVCAAPVDTTEALESLLG